MNEKVKTFLRVLERKGGVVNTVVSVATAKALIGRSQDEHLKCLDLDSSYWAKSLFRRMGFTKQTCITSKPEIPELAKKEAKLFFQNQIAKWAKHYHARIKTCINQGSIIQKINHNNIWNNVGKLREAFRGRNYLIPSH